MQKINDKICDKINDEIRHKEKLLKQHKKNLQEFELQEAQYGAGETRLNLINQI